MEPKFVNLDAFTVMGVLIHSMPDKVDFDAFWENESMPHHEAIRKGSGTIGYADLSSEE